MNYNPYKLVTFAALVVLFVGTILILLYRKTSQPDAQSIQIALPSPMPSKEQQEQAKIQLTRIKLGTLKNGVYEYYLRMNKYPESLQDLLCKGENDEACVSTIRTDDLKDPWGTPFMLEQNGNARQITSLGKDGKVGGDGSDHDTSISISSF